MPGSKNHKTVFITGGTGYIGTRLIRKLTSRGHRVIALVRDGSEQKVPAGAEAMTGNPFIANTFQSYIPADAVFVQLLGVSHPSPKKGQQFKDIDLKSVKASADAAAGAGVSNFIYISVSMTPTRLMQAYQEVRKQGEEYCLGKKINCTFIRPWYVLGPGHWWPFLLIPLYGLAEIVPFWRVKARARALVTIRQMLVTLVKAVESEPERLTVYEIHQIRNSAIDNSLNRNTRSHELPDK